MQVVSAGASHVGRVREVNEDGFLARGSIAIVADGMGGHAAGDVASALTVGAFEKLVERPSLEPNDVLAAIERANQSILDAAIRRPERSGLGTTLTGVAMVAQAESPHWFVFNIGDSRVYRVDGTGLRQLTIDHSEVAALVAAGRISADEALQHPLRNIVTRSLGTSPAPTADTWLVPAEPDDLFLICSDGLPNELGDDDIATIVNGSPDLVSATARLIEATLSVGARDNVTVVLAKSQIAGPTAASSAASSTRPRSAIGASS